MGILDKAVEKYGERQLDQCQEELAELIVAISKYKRAVAKGNGSSEIKAITDVIEEIADVRIMIKQVMMLLDINETEVSNIEISKLNRGGKVLKYLSLFSGIGSPEQALKNLGVEFELFGFSEIDKYAIKSYCAVHGVDESLNLGDITKIDTESLPLDIDLITHGSPCQDFSVAGSGKGGDIGTGTRSSLMWNTVAICEHCKPKYVIWENVKNVLSKKHRHNFDKYLEEMERIGYNNFYQVLNAKDYGVPQNRERIFVISIRKDIEKDFKFPKGFDNGIRLKDILEEEVEEKYYINTEKAEKLIQEFKSTNKKTLNINPSGKGMNGVVRNDEIASTVTTNKGEGQKVVIPCITPDRLEKRQNGRRFKEDGEPMFTLTSQDKHGVLEAKRIGGIFDDEKGKHQAGSVWDTKGLSPTLDTMQGGYRQPCIIEDLK